MYRMTSPFTQSELLDDYTTTPFDNEDEVIVNLAIDDDLSANTTVPFILNNAPCGRDCFMSASPTDNRAPRSFFSPELLISLTMLILVITICVIIAFRYFQQSQRQQHRRGRLETEKVHARPFEIIVAIDQPEAMELLEIGSATTTSPTGTTK